jgi:hypothetical protein
MRFFAEWSGVIDAATQEDADALADQIAAGAFEQYGPLGTSVQGQAVVANMSAEVVTPKVKESA